MSEIQDQLTKLLKTGGDDYSGEYIPGEDGDVNIPNRELSPIEVKEISSEFRKIIKEGEEGIPEDTIVDYLYARDFLYTLLEEASKALNGAMGLAADTDQPRAYGVVRELLETSRELTKDIMALQKTYKEIKKLDPPKEPTPKEGEGGGDIPMSSSNILSLLEEADKESELDDE